MKTNTQSFWTVFIILLILGISLFLVVYYNHLQNKHDKMKKQIDKLFV